jgi:hypothetical protein
MIGEHAWRISGEHGWWSLGEHRWYIYVRLLTLPSSEGARPSLTEVAYISPRAAVVEAWLDLEAAAMEASKRHNLNLTSKEIRSPLTLGKALEEAGILDDKKLEIYHRLRNLRNAAAHATNFAFDPELAIEYANLADRLVKHIQQT